MLLDVLPLSLGLETLGGVMTKVIERNTTIPARRTETFSTAEDNQTAVDVVVLQGERELAADNRQLARFRLEGIGPAPRGIPQIEVTFDVDANGILNVSARDKATGKEQRVTISESSNLDQGEVEEMIRLAEAHADEDRRRREEIDARNELDSLAYRVEQLVTELQERLPVNEKARAEQGVAEARQAIADEVPIDRLRQLISDLQQLVAALPSSAAAAAQASATSGNGAGNGAAAPSEDEGRWWMPSSPESDTQATPATRSGPSPTTGSSSPSWSGSRTATSGPSPTWTTTASERRGRWRRGSRRPRRRSSETGWMSWTAWSAPCRWRRTSRAAHGLGGGPGAGEQRARSERASTGSERPASALTPSSHAAIAVQDSAEAPDQTILAVQRSGFALGDRVIRPAQVVVARPPQSAG